MAKNIPQKLFVPYFNESLMGKLTPRRSQRQVFDPATNKSMQRKRLGGYEAKRPLLGRSVGQVIPKVEGRKRALYSRCQFECFRLVKRSSNILINKTSNEIHHREVKKKSKNTFQHKAKNTLTYKMMSMLTKTPLHNAWAYFGKWPPIWNKV